MTVEEARKILGDKGTNLSDKDIESMIIKMKQLSTIVITQLQRAAKQVASQDARNE